MLCQVCGGSAPCGVNRQCMDCVCGSKPLLGAMPHGDRPANAQTAQTLVALSALAFSASYASTLRCRAVESGGERVVHADQGERQRRLAPRTCGHLLQLLRLLLHQRLQLIPL